MKVDALLDHCGILDPVIENAARCYARRSSLHFSEREQRRNQEVVLLASILVVRRNSFEQRWKEARKLCVLG
jgi:hypothetical protein